MTGVSLAEGGDDDKKKENKSGTEDKLTHADSLDADIIYDSDIINSDDTLVFEDWESPQDNGDDNDDWKNASLDNGTFGDKYRNGTSLNSVSIADISKTFKKEYKVEFTVFPNPTANVLHINPSIEPNSIRIADITGKEHHVSSFSSQVNVADLPIGTYFIQLIYADHIEARKFIKS